MYSLKDNNGNYIKAGSNKDSRDEAVNMAFNDWAKHQSVLDNKNVKAYAKNKDKWLENMHLTVEQHDESVTPTTQLGE